MQLTEATQLMPGLVVTPLSTGLVRVDIDMDADPEGLTSVVIAELARQMGGVDSWQFRKEMLRDPNAQSGEGVFERSWIDVQRSNVRNPLMRMEVGENGTLYEKSDGRIRIWIPPDRMPVNLPQGTASAQMMFGLGVDVGAGTFQSDSTIEGFAVQGMEQAVEFNANNVTPVRLGHIAVAIARHYNDALVCCVQKMHGITTIRTMTDECGYPNLWRNVSHDKTVETSTGRLGWVHGENSQALLMDRVGDALQRPLSGAYIYEQDAGANVDVLSARGVIVRSADLLDQLRQYIFDDSGRAVLSKNRDLNPQARKQHGDLVVGTGLSIRACMDMPPWRNAVATTIKANTIEWFMERHRKADKKERTGAWQ